MTAFQVGSNNVPAYPGTGLSTAEMTRILTGLDPAAVQEAGAAHSSLGRELATMAGHLAQHTETLAQHWSGTAARTALARFQRLHEQTVVLAAQAARTGTVLTWLGTQVLPAFQHPADPAQARQYLSELSACLVRANSSLPSQIGPTSPADYVTPRSLKNHNGISSNSSLMSGGNSVSNAGAVPQAGPSPDTAGHSLPSSGGSGGGPAAAGNVPLTAGPGPTASPVSSLQSAAPVPGTPAVTSAAPASAAPAAPAAAGVTGAPTPVPLVPAPSTSVSQTRQPAGSDARKPTAAIPLPAAHRAGASPAAGGNPATGASLATGTGPVLEVPGADGPALSAHPLPELPGLDTAGLHGAGLDSGLSGGDLGGLPVTGGVSGQPGRERRRQAWATEDRNIWGLPSGCVPPVIEGG